MGGRGSKGVERGSAISDTPLYEMTSEQMQQEYDELTERRKTDNNPKLLNRYMALKKALNPQAVKAPKKRNYQVKRGQSKGSIRRR